MDEKIVTRHPNGKSGVNISRAKYEIIKAAVIDALQSHPDMTFSDLVTSAETKLAGQFDGSIPWYVTTVKLDLEARGVLERVSKSSPQRLRLVE